MIDITKMTDEQIKAWVLGLKEHLKTKKEFKKSSEHELNCAVMDGMFQGFLEGDLRRIDLAKIATILGFEVDEEFMNDPHPDPYYAKHKK